MNLATSDDGPRNGTGLRLERREDKSKKDDCAKKSGLELNSVLSSRSFGVRPR